MSNTGRAIVADEPGENHKHGDNWELKNVTVRDLNDGELLVDMVASGICHSDFLTTSMPTIIPGFAYPRIAGHEGSGYIKAIGPHVTKDVAVGDPVLLSFDYCGNCDNCQRKLLPYCAAFVPLNIVGPPDVFRDQKGKGIVGKHFGQSSFASLSVVSQNSVLPAKDLIQGREELQLFAPLGCGLQTGAGAILNTSKPDKTDRVLILGLGGVGLSAIMAAKLLGVKQIIAVDRMPSRIELAKSFGATDGLDTTGIDDLVTAFKEITGGLGATVVVDTTGVLSVVEAGYNSVAARGKFLFVGASNDLGWKMTIPVGQHTANGTQLIGCCEGDSIPYEFIPQLIKHFREGNFPIDKIAKFYKADDYQSALLDMHTGDTIKPILLW